MAIINGTKFDDTLAGTTGDDTIKGAAGNDTINGGNGNDLVIGGLGADIIDLGDGNDRFQWGANDASDTVEGGSAADTGQLIGVAGNESIGVTTFAGDIRMADFQSIGGPVVTIDDVERLEINPLGGSDFVTIHDTTGSDLQTVAIDLATTMGGKTADTKTDTVMLFGTLQDNAITATIAGSKITVDGLATTLTIDHVGKTDIVQIDGGSGNDTIDASKIAAGKAVFGLGGGIGEDVIFGSQGNDLAVGGSGNDIILLDGGDDYAIWEDFGGNDAVEGGAGTDTADARGGSGILEMFAIGGRARMRQIDNGMVLDTGGIERFVFRNDGDGDSVKVGDLSGTSVNEVVIDLAVASSGNGKLDEIALQAGAGNDVITTKVVAATTTVSGLPTKLSITHADGDRLGIDGGDGNDSINVSAVSTKVIGQFDLFGGSGSDTIRGSVAADNIDGGGSNDLFLWNHGDGSDNFDGSADFDTLRVTGAALGESILLGSIGGQTKLIHGPDGATLTLQAVERVQLAALGGADLVFVQNLAGTGIAEVAIDLAATVGGKTADTKVDAVAFSGTTGGDTIVLSMLGSKISVSGLAVTASVDRVGKADILTIIGGDGHDLISAGTIAAGKVALQLVGGDGLDAIVGSSGNDSVVGGTGNDTVDLGAGNDIFICQVGDETDQVDGGAGNDTFQFVSASGLGIVSIARDVDRIDLTRQIDTATAHLNNIERIELLAGGVGFDGVTIDNLAGTDVKLVAVDFGSTGGTKGDSQSDFALIYGGNGNETVTLAMSAGVLSVKGLATQVTLAHTESLDALTINAEGGNDSINAATVPVAAAQIYMNGGAGNDKLTGHLGYNAVSGDDGNDTLGGGAGNDSLLGGSGNDKIDGGAGNDGILGGADNDYLVGGTGDDTIVGELGNDTITGGTGSDLIYYTSVLDGHDVIIGFDGNAAGGQDVLDLSSLFGALAVPTADRAARVSIIDKGASVEIKVDTNGDLNFDLHVATLKTADAISIGPDIVVGL